MKFLLLTFFSSLLFFQHSFAQKKEKPSSGKRPGLGLQVAGIHPFFEIENLHPQGDTQLKIAAMCFDGDDLYITCFSPDRTNKSPDHQGAAYKLPNITAAKSAEDVTFELIADNLYEPGAIGIINGKIYIGEKLQIIRLDDKNNDNFYNQDERTVLIDELSDINFHTWVIGFEKYKKDGETYLCGNFTTHIQMGGKRIPNTQKNNQVKRGSTFILGPITGSETAKEITIDYIAGGFRTPNGIMVDDENNVYVADNQGVFNPANKLIKLTQDSFYGHYLLTDKNNGKPAAFQPTDVDSEKGNSGNRTPATLYLPQSTNIARSPAQPAVIKNQTGQAAVFNGQLLVPDFTSGSLHRASLEEVDGYWQGALFRFSANQAKADGTDGFTGGVNRLIIGPDNHYYIGQIGAERLWQYNKDHGIQRLKAKQKITNNINDILNAKLIKGGIEIEFIQPLPAEVLKKQLFKIKQWTYIPTNGYGGAPIGTENLTSKSIKILEDGKKVQLLIDGLKDLDSPILKKGAYTNENMGWVLHVSFDPKMDNKPLLWGGEFWYTMLKNMNDKSTQLSNEAVEVTETLDAQTLYTNMCASCHSLDGKTVAGPSFKDLFDKEQIVIRGGKEVKVKVTREYLANAIKNPLSEYPKGLVPAMPELGLNNEQINSLVEFIARLDGE